MRITKVQSVAKESLEKLKKYQSGELKPIHTGFELFDNAPLPLLPGDIVGIAGNSGGGKSKMLQELRNNIMSHQGSENYVWLDNQLEMKFLSTILRDLHEKFGVDKRTILTKPFDEEQKKEVNNYYKFISDDRFFINEEVFTADEFLEAIEAFLELHKDKEVIFVTIDHMALIKSGGEKKGAIDGVVEMMNALKKKYPNVVFIMLSQYNRGFLGRLGEKTSESFPSRQDLYQSDTMYHICDFVIGLVIPMSNGILEYGKVNSDKYSYLSEHFSDDPDVKNRISFLTENRVFYHKIKDREGGLFYQDIYIREIKNMIKKEPSLEYEIQPQPISVGLFIDDNLKEDNNINKF